MAVTKLRVSAGVRETFLITMSLQLRLARRGPRPPRTLLTSTSSVTLAASLPRSAAGTLVEQPIRGERCSCPPITAHLERSRSTRRRLGTARRLPRLARAAAQLTSARLGVWRHWDQEEQIWSALGER